MIDKRLLTGFLFIALPSSLLAAHPVPRDHPRLLGSRQYLQRLAAERKPAYDRVVQVARNSDADDHSKIISMALVTAIEQDPQLGRAAVDRAMTYITGSIRTGHVTFGSDLALCAIAYDLCHEHWTAAERAAFCDYVNKTVDANVDSETHVFHNGWYAYKNWGIGLACYAAYHENPRAPQILQTLRTDWLTRAAPAVNLACAGGGWAEGYYGNYCLYEWLFFCEVALRCEGVDYYADAEPFFKHRAVASMFEAYPGISTYNSRRAIPMGDGGGRVFGGDRDKTLSARRILVNHYRDDLGHQAVHAFNEVTPRSAVGDYAYKDFLWRDPTVSAGELAAFKLSHISTGPGYVYARSSWSDDATHFFFKCGDRFTAHQHLDVGHFLIYKHDELAGDGGHYDAFGSKHDVNYHLRTIAHNTILIFDPAETWPGIRAGSVSSNDGGQHHNWPHHNGAVTDPQAWEKGRTLYDIGDILAFEDKGEYVYIAADCTGAYSPNKLELFTRQIVYLRPDTFVIFDRVKTTRPNYKKTWLLQAMQTPTQDGDTLTITNGKGRLFVQTLLPENPEVELISGDNLYKVGERTYYPNRKTGPAPTCRIEISPTEPAQTNYFLNILTAAMADTVSVPKTTIAETPNEVTVQIAETQLNFQKQSAAAHIRTQGKEAPLAARIMPN
ncbi:MAG: heparinase II/III family protein [Phycisphaerae bacterium]|nr:heparinase II/III family protein [Phycisphaerae bacterium]